MTKKYKILFISLIMAFCLFGCEKKENAVVNNQVETTEEIIDNSIDEIELYEKTDDIDMTGLNEKNIRLRIFANTLGTSVLNEDYHIKLMFLDEMSNKRTYYELTYDEPVIVVDMPRSTYRIAIEEQDPTCESSLEYMRETLNSDVATLRVDVIGIAQTQEQNAEDENVQNQEEEHSFIYNLIVEDFLVILLLVVSIGILIYRKKILKR